MNRLLLAIILVFALAGCASAPPERQPVAADPASAGPASCTGDRFYEGMKSYARCIRHVASPPRPMLRQIRSAVREPPRPITGDAWAEQHTAG